jgi:hypothetical protein
MMCAAALLLLLPETKGKEPEDLWPDLASAGEGVHADPDPAEHDHDAQPRPVGEHGAQERGGAPDPVARDPVAPDPMAPDVVGDGGRQP